MTMRFRVFGLWVAMLALLTSALSFGCKRRVGDEFSLGAEDEKTAKPLPALALSDDTADVLLTWIDARGDAHTAHKTADVAPEGRERVRVVVTTREEGTGALFYVANLSSKNPDGTYPVSTVSRTDWDALIAERRQAFAAPAASADPGDLAPSPGTTKPGAQAHPASFTVIVYGAAWCGACHEAVAYLKRRKVPVIEKDIEQDPAAQSEMQAKLARAGVHGGSIPVIDVRGKILIGFEPHALDAAVRGASAAVTL
jgi:glutaredoxin